MSPFEQFCRHAECCVRHFGKALSALWLSRARELALWILVGTLSILLLTGCSLLRFAHKATVKGNNLVAGAQAEAPKDNGTPATVASSGEETSLAIPAGSTITETTIEAKPAVPASAAGPAQPAEPRHVVREIHFNSDSAILQKAQHVATSTGTIDTAVALRRVDAEEARWLLWAAIGCGLSGLIVRSMLPAWPGLSNGLFAGAVCAFIAWKFSALPAWFWLIPIALLGAKALGYKRAEWDANGDGIPDILQKK